MADKVEERKSVIHLVSTRRSQWPWGLGNEIYRPLRKMGYRVIDTDYRKDSDRLPELLSQRADLVIVIKGQSIPSQLIERISCPKVLWYPDDIFAFSPARPTISRVGFAYDIVYTFDKVAISEVRSLGGKDVRWLPFGCNLNIHKKMELPKIYDLSFVGNLHPNRLALFPRLQRKFNFFIAAGTYMLKMVKIFNQSKVVFNLAIGKTGCNQRVFEALGGGSFLLTNEIPMDGRIFEDKRHLVYFNEENLEELIEYYLASEEEREEIASEGHREVIENHTYTIGRLRYWKIP